LRLKSGLHNEGDMRMVPFWGHIAAGAPIEAVGINDEVVPVAADYAPEGTYALKVKGQSMIDALIDDGDIIIVQPAETAENGEMVVATLTDTRGANPEATLKRFYREKDRIRLQPANSQMEPIYVHPDQVRIQGKIKAVLRRL
jgi:repressor LexA